MAPLSDLLVIRSRRDIWSLVIAICGFAIFASVSLGYVLTAPQDRGPALQRAVLISSVISIPVAYWMAKGLWVIQRLNEQLEFMLNHDPLTEVFTRRYFFDAFRGAFRDRACVVALVDIDHFKSINDTFGHHVGDTMLRMVSVALTEPCDKDDFVVRLGGEEFAVCFFDLMIEDGVARAEELRQSVERRELEVGQRMVGCTVSVGLGVYRPGDKIDAVLQSADAALYLAKRSGRNQVRQLVA